MKVKDITGKRFGMLLVLERAGSSSSGKAKWLCQCDCGNLSTPTGDKLRRGKTVSCGCLHGSFKKKDLTGKKFGLLTAIEPIRADEYGHSYYLCFCECGEQTIVRTDSLTSGDTRSCGCFLKEAGKLRRKGNITIRSAGRIKYWKDELLESCGYVCSKCGDDENLIAHHLNGFDNYPELRYELNNGVILCKECHTEFHIKYGYGNNTKEQYDEWIKIEEPGLSRFLSP